MSDIFRWRTFFFSLSFRLVVLLSLLVFFVVSLASPVVVIFRNKRWSCVPLFTLTCLPKVIGRADVTANIHLISVEHYLQAALLNERLKEQQQPTGNIDHSLHYAEITLHFLETSAASDDEDEIWIDTEEQFLLQPSESATRYVFVNSRIDYQYRSSALESISLFDYTRLFRKNPINANDRKQLQT